MYSAIGVEPTKLTAATSGCARSASTASLSPLTTLKTPSGSPAAFSSSAMRCRGGVALRRLQHEGVAAGERHREHPHRHHRREIEGRDPGADAERLAHRPAVDAAPDLLRILALQKLRDTAGELDDLEAARHLAARVGEDLPVLRRDQRRDAFGLAFEELAELEHDAGADERRRRRPLGKGGCGGAHRRIDLARPTHRHLARALAGRRIVDIAEPPRFPFPAAAADVMQHRLRHELLLLKRMIAKKNRPQRAEPPRPRKML
jgi:hypothetical protein